MRSMRASAPAVLVKGLGHAEGPSTLDGGDCMFCVSYDGSLGRWFSSTGRTVFTKVGGSPFGTALGSDGCLYVANNGGAIGRYRSEDFRSGRIERVGPTGDVELIAACAGKRRLNMPNDLAFGPDGWLYFTDPGRWALESEWEDGFLYAIGRDGSIEVVVNVGKTFPNGIGCEPDGNVVWVESYSRRVRRRRLDGRIETLATLDSGHIPDGLAISEDGFIWVASLSSGGIDVVSPHGGLVDFLLVPGATPSNVAFSATGLFVTDVGDSPASTAEAVHQSRLLHVELGVSGAPLYRGEIRSSGEVEREGRR